MEKRMSSSSDNDDPRGAPEGEDPARTALIEEEVARASAPYVGVFPEDVLDETRRLHRVALRTNPSLVALIDQLCPVPAVQTSHKLSTARGRTGNGKKVGGAS
jgi:hypothetical protein